MGARMEPRRLRGAGAEAAALPGFAAADALAPPSLATPPDREDCDADRRGWGGTGAGGGTAAGAPVPALPRAREEGAAPRGGLICTES